MKLAHFSVMLIICWSVFTVPLVFSSSNYTEIYKWVKEELVTEAPKSGVTLKNTDMDTIQQWIPPGMIEEFKFPELELNIQKPKVEKPHTTYLTATKKWANTAKIESDGSLSNYKAGQPFSDNQIKNAPSNISGFMIGWNNIHRWQHFGYKIDLITMAYVSGSEEVGPLNQNEGLLGGGKLDRLLSQSYHRVYLNKLAMLPKGNYKLDLKDSDTRFYKDYFFRKQRTLF